MKTSGKAGCQMSPQAAELETELWAALETGNALVGWQCLVSIAPLILEWSGGCLVRGACCRAFSLMFSGKFVRDESDLQQIQSHTPSWRHFFALPASDHPHAQFSCRALREDGKCGIHSSRPAVCIDYPSPTTLLQPESLLSGCGYVLRPKLDPPLLQLRTFRLIAKALVKARHVKAAFDLMALACVEHDAE